MARYVQSVVSNNVPTISPIVWRHIDMDTQLINNDSVFVDVSNGIVNLILPTTPINASVIKISHVAGDIVQYNIIVQAIGKQINANAILTIKTMFRTVELIYNSVIAQWTISSDTIGSGGNSQTIVEVNTDTFAKNNDFIYVDTSINEVTITLPEDPIIGNDITIVDKSSTFNTNSCIIARNNKKILSKNDDIFLDMNKTITKFVYFDDSIGWKIFDVFANKWIGVSEFVFFNDNGFLYYLVSISAQLQNNSVYFINTSNYTCNLTLPSSSILGDVILIIDYASTFNINNCIVSGKIDGDIGTLTLDIQNSVTRLIYAGDIQGWIIFSITDNATTLTPSVITDIYNISCITTTIDLLVTTSNIVFVDTRVNSVDITLPTPSVGLVVRIIDFTSSFNINNCIISAGNVLINATADNVILDENNRNSVFIYINEQIGWSFYSSLSFPQDLTPDIASINLITTNFRSVSTSTILVNLEMVFVDTRTGPITLTLPQTSTLGDYIVICDAYSNFAVNNCILINNGNNIEGLMESLVIDNAGQRLTLIYSGAEFGWIIW